MKPIHLALVALVIVLGAALLLNMKPKEAAAPSPTSNTPTETSQNQTNTQAQDNTMTPEEHAAMMGESTKGTDAGMEMPMTDTVPAATQTGGDMKMFTINGSNFAFDVKEMRVKQGDTVMIHFMSADGFHDLVIDEFNVKTERLKTGGMGMATFVADKKGTFEYYCSVGSHRANGMVGKLIVE